jgi:hypothetical protein
MCPAARSSCESRRMTSTSKPATMTSTPKDYRFRAAPASARDAAQKNEDNPR